MNMTLIANGLRMIADGLEDSAAATVRSDKKADTKVKPDVPAKKAAEEEAVTSAPEAEKDEPATKEQVIGALQLVAKMNGRAGIDKILADFNVDKVSALSEDDYADVLTVAEASLV